MVRSNSSLKHQTGMTFIGIVLLFLFAGIFAMAGLRLLPLYMENLAVTQSIESFKEEFRAKPNMTTSEMKKILQTKLGVQDVNNLKVKDIKFKKGRGGYDVDASYSPKVNYLGNVNFVVDFEHKFKLEK